MTRSPSEGIREQHPDGLQQDSTSSYTLTYYIFYFMLSFSRQTDINYFQGDPSQLGHHQGPREQHPDGIEYLGFDFIMNPHILYVLCMFFKTHRYKLVSWMSESTRSPSGTSRATS